ncbi:YaaL family protein [Paenibacillus sp. y28]|uniref:YaaL family protein n=1 Tax=Paenibacillus sp. y28 TaxID=3129110 RepID=UPI003016D5FF
MNWLRIGLGRGPVDPALKDKQRLAEEIKEAQTDWVHARKRLDYVVEEDQIDYAIYLLEAAETRYSMLLKQAKRMQLSVLDEGIEHVVQHREEWTG